MHFKGVKEHRLFQEWIERSRAKGYVDRELYRLKRYGSPVTIGMHRSKDPNFAEKFYLHSRRTDHLITLADNHYLSLFDHTEISGAIKAVENLVTYMEIESQKDRAALTQLNKDDGLDDALKRLLSLFLIACKGNDSIVDDSYLMR